VLSARQSLDRGLRGVDRIQGQLESLRSFASAEERSAPEARAAVKSSLDQVLAARADVQATVSAELGDQTFVRCSEEVLDRILRAMLTDAVERSGGQPIRVQATESRRWVRIDIQGGPASPRGDDPFSAHIRGPDSGYPGIDLAMLSARRLAESHGGGVASRSVGDACVTRVELPRA